MAIFYQIQQSILHNCTCFKVLLVRQEFNRTH